MWGFSLSRPGRFSTLEAHEPIFDDAPEGSLLLRVITVGICGSDLAPFRQGGLGDPASVSRAVAEDPKHCGYPLHEVLGEVVASKHPDHDVGTLVVGWASERNALAQFCIADGAGLATYDPTLDVESAIMLQPLACVLYAMDQIGSVDNAHVAVIGLGPIGLLFTHVAKSRGARVVTGIDLVDRRDVGATFGIDEVVWSSSRQWSAQLGDERPDVVIEAVGHQVSTMVDAVEAVSFGGTVYYFGIPDDQYYPFPIARFLRKNLTLIAGVTLERRLMLEVANTYLQSHRHLASIYVSDVYGFDPESVQQAFDAANRPSEGRFKVAMTLDRRRGVVRGRSSTDPRATT